MPSEKPSGSTPQPSTQAERPVTSSSEMLTPSELASLRQAAKEGSEYGRKAFAHLRKTPAP